MFVTIVLCTLYIHSKTTHTISKKVSDISEKFREFEPRVNVNQMLYLSNPISVSLSNARISSQGTPTQRCILCLFTFSRVMSGYTANIYIMV